MRVHVLQHVPFEDIGSMAGWLVGQEAQLNYSRLFLKPDLPEVADLDLVIAMGGPMSVNDESLFPWLRQEKLFLREAIGRGVAVVGVCLGAQLIADAMGARVYPNPVKEIGWFPIEAVPGEMGGFRFPLSCPVFHWHGETFDLPSGAIHLASSRACKHQAFQLGRRVMGLQFHLETTPQSAAQLIEPCRDELVPGPFVHSESELLAAPLGAYTRVNDLMVEVLDYVTAPN